MRANRWLILFILMTVGIGGYSLARSSQENSRRDESKKRASDQETMIEALINDARSVAPEFAADLLLQIAKSSLVKQDKKAGLVEEAFRLASDAKYKIKRSALPGSIVDTRSGYLARAFELNLDALSLQTGAVKAMLPLDKSRARQLFNEIPQVQIPPLTCEEALIYSPDEYYDTLKEVAGKTFSGEERERGEQIFFIERQITSLSSPVQLGPMARAMMGIDLSSEHLQLLIDAFNERLKHVEGDNYSFATTMMPLSSTIDQLAKHCQNHGISHAGLIESFRAYLIAHLNAERCAGSISARVEASYLKLFNGTLLPRYLPDKVTTLTINQDEIKPRRSAQKARYDLYWESPKSKNILAKFRHLRFGSENNPVTESVKERPEWQVELSNFMTELSDWRADQERSESDYFHQKHVIYQALLEIVPTKSNRDNLIASYLSFLKESGLKRESSIEWFLHARELIDLYKSSTGQEHARFSAALNNDGDVVLRLYVTVEKLLPQSGLEAHKN